MNFLQSNPWWTSHVQRKMRQYGLSEARVKRVLRNFNRKEKGIVPNTIAVMQKAGTIKRPYEIWVMYQIRSKIKNLQVAEQSSLRGRQNSNSKFIIITAWKYPGVSPIRDEIPIPLDILEELKNLNL